LYILIFTIFFIDDSNSDQEDSDSSESNLNPIEHKKSLMKLKEIVSARMSKNINYKTTIRLNQQNLIFQN